MKKTILITLLTSAILFSVGLVTVSAQTNDVNIKIENPFDGPSTLPAVFKAIIDKILLPIGSIVVVIAFIFSGFQYVMARGNEEKISKAHSSLLYTAIGTVLILGAWVISTVIENTLNQIRG